MKRWFIRIDMRFQLHCIVRFHVYLKEKRLISFSHGTILFLLCLLSPWSIETKCRTGANSSSRKKGFTKPGSLTNTNIIEKKCLFPGTVGPSWTWTKDLAREVNHHTYGPTNWEWINRFLFRSDSSFLNAAYNSPLYSALQVCLFPLSSYHGKSLWNNSVEKKKEGIKRPSWPNPRHSKIVFQTCSHFESRDR